VIDSSLAGSAATLTTASAQISADYLSIKDSTPTQTNTWYAEVNSTLVSNTGNWILVAPPSDFLRYLKGNLWLKGNMKFK
jgi:hypothetical protein